MDQKNKRLKKFRKDIALIENKLRGKRIVIVSGGFSEERKTSIESGDAVFAELKNKGFDVLKIDPKKDDINPIWRTDDVEVKW